MIIKIKMLNLQKTDAHNKIWDASNRGVEQSPAYQQYSLLHQQYCAAVTANQYPQAIIIAAEIIALIETKYKAIKSYVPQWRDEVHSRYQNIIATMSIDIQYIFHRLCNPTAKPGVDFLSKNIDSTKPVTSIKTIFNLICLIRNQKLFSNDNVSLQDLEPLLQLARDYQRHSNPVVCYLACLVMGQHEDALQKLAECSQTPKKNQLAIVELIEMAPLTDEQKRQHMESVCGIKPTDEVQCGTGNKPGLS